jgi:hypothetical protein
MKGWKEIWSELDNSDFTSDIINIVSLIKSKEPINTYPKEDLKMTKLEKRYIQLCAVRRTIKSLDYGLAFTTLLIDPLIEKIVDENPKVDFSILCHKANMEFFAKENERIMEL